MGDPWDERFPDFLIVSKHAINNEIAPRVGYLSLMLAHFTNARSCSSVNLFPGLRITAHRTDYYRDISSHCGELSHVNFDNEVLERRNGTAAPMIR